MTSSDPASSRPGGRRRRAGAFHDRTATEAALRQAAVDILRRQGVLAGLNLREVADEAGVNRGLVYQYFGNRRDLLRSALHEKARENRAEMSAAEGRSLRRRLSNLFWSSLRLPEPIRLVALLALDGDTRPRILPNRRAGRATLAADAASGELAHPEDVDAAQAVLAATIYGYTLFREHLAREMDLPVDALDKRVDAYIQTLFANPAAEPPDHP